MLDQINTLREKGTKELKALTSLEQLRNWHQQYLGKKGDLTTLLKQLANIPIKERPLIGKVINDVKREFQDLFDLSQKKIFEKKLNKVIINIDRIKILMFLINLTIK